MIGWSKTFKGQLNWIGKFWGASNILKNISNLQKVFGATAYQTPTQLIITKSDLGITKQSSTAESLFAAVVSNACIGTTGNDSSMEFDAPKTFYDDSSIITLFTVGFLKAANINDDEIQDDTTTFNVMDY